VSIGACRTLGPLLSGADQSHAQRVVLLRAHCKQTVQVRGDAGYRENPKLPQEYGVIDSKMPARIRARGGFHIDHRFELGTA